ncbi:MAG: hypothetical protein QM808_16615 [Steroidobacteraceae bacterium]
MHESFDPNSHRNAVPTKSGITANRQDETLMIAPQICCRCLARVGLYAEADVPVLDNAIEDSDFAMVSDS